MLPVSIDSSLGVVMLADLLRGVEEHTPRFHFHLLRYFQVGSPHFALRIGVVDDHAFALLQALPACFHAVLLCLQGVIVDPLVV